MGMGIQGWCVCAGRGIGAVKDVEQASLIWLKNAPVESSTTVYCLKTEVSSAHCVGYKTGYGCVLLMATAMCRLP